MIPISPRSAVRILALGAIALALAGLAAVLLRASIDRSVQTAFHLPALFRQFDLDQENNVPSWFSTICLFCSSVLLALLAGSDPAGGVRRRRQWAGLAIIFVLLSLDEAASFHEMLNTLRHWLHASGPFASVWILFGAGFALACLWAFWDLLRSLPRPTRLGIVASGIIFCSGALFMEMPEATEGHAHGMSLKLGLMAVLEESLEMAGEVLFIRTLLNYLASSVGSVALVFHTAKPPAPSRIILFETENARNLQ